MTSILAQDGKTYHAVDNTYVSRSGIWLNKVLQLHPHTAVVAVTFADLLHRKTMRFLRCNHKHNLIN